MKKNKKLFVLDTNVILYDSSCIYNFNEHDIVIPLCVIEELDSFKKGNNLNSFHAREFIRKIDGLDDKLFNGGASIREGNGKISLATDVSLHETVKKSFSVDIIDHRILSITLRLTEERQKSKEEVILVSKDTDLRLKAKSLGINAEDYQHDQVDLAHLYSGIFDFREVSDEEVHNLYSKPEREIEWNPSNHGLTLYPNQCGIIGSSNTNSTALVIYKDNILTRVEKWAKVKGLKPRNAEQTFALHLLLDRNISLVTLNGIAGTGKTLMALIAAIDQIKHYSHIYVARPVVALENKDIGFLPGDIDHKLGPFMQPIYDNLSVIKAKDAKWRETILRLEKEKQISIEALSFIRGRSIPNSIIIIDEAQNLTPHEVKTIITRAGEGSKVIFTGDIHQVDTPYLDSKSNGLSCLIEKAKGAAHYGHVTMVKGERSPLSEWAANTL
ncbi:PhoH family protein [Candidatus Gracilibacteria bacterium]|nr:PhoH family protein [Candidatus Gracilibacteria bacterium]